MLRCLIVTGDKQVRDTILVGLQQIHACETATATDRWALQIVRDEPVDVVIADARLEDGTAGMDFLRDVRDAQPGAQLVLVAHGKAGARVSGRDRDELDIAAVIRVPITTSEFFRSMSRVMSRVGAALAG